MNQPLSLVNLSFQLEELSLKIQNLSLNVWNLSQQVDEMEANNIVDVGNLNFAWILFCTFLVFFMQTGFMILETGGVARKILYESIILKNMINSSISCIVFYLVGYGFAFGDGGSAPGFIGANYFGLSNDPPLQLFFWQWAFLSTCTTIVSGAMAERTRLRSHCYWVVIASLFVYPLCAHWIWSDDGWLSAKRKEEDLLIANGVFDFAGSGVIHLLGGTAGVVGAIITGKRVGRYEDTYERRKVFLPQNVGEMALGTFILWFSWYGFNCGSTVTLDSGRSAVAAKAAVCTTLSASVSGVVALLLAKLRTGKWSLPTFLNGVLGGLVAITAGCAFVEPWGAFIIGFFAGLIYYGATIVETYFRIDDVIEVGPVHMACGFWGLIAVGLFATKENIFILYGRDDQYGLFVGGGALQFCAQLVAAVVILAWSLFWSILLFWGLNRMGHLRIDLDWERRALEEELLQNEVKSTLRLMAHNYDLDKNFVRNIESDSAGDITVIPNTYQSNNEVDLSGMKIPKFQNSPSLLDLPREESFSTTSSIDMEKKRKNILKMGGSLQEISKRRTTVPRLSHHSKSEKSSVTSISSVVSITEINKQSEVHNKKLKTASSTKKLDTHTQDRKIQKESDGPLKIEPDFQNPSAVQESETSSTSFERN